VNVGVCYSRIREDEKLLLGELRERDHEVTKIDVRRETFDCADPPESFAGVDVLVDRCLATSRSRYVTQFADRYEIPIVNDAATARICADKVETSLALDGAGVPTPTTRVAFTSDEALDAAAELGYPCVVKPVVGSWGRLMAKLDSPNTAEAVFEHKEVLGHYEHKVFYLQEFVDKPGRDIRVLAADGEVIAAMVRSSDHWLTNAAKGAETATFEVSDEVRELVREASAAVGGGLLGIDLMERTDAEQVTGYTVHEINHTVEFKALDGVSDEDVPARVVDYLETVGDGNE